MAKVTDRAAKVLVLDVDLTAGKLETQDLGLEFRKKYIGSRGVDSRILYDSVGPKVDALSPGNVLMFGTGALGGTPSPSSSRMTITSKSPICGFGSSSVGGYFPPELRKAGYDHIAVRGKAEGPVYLWIDNGKAEIRSASHLWGKGVFETNRLIKEELGDPDIKVLAIGQAGETLSKIAEIMVSPNRAGGSRIGSVMGSKKLKAIAVRGSGKIDVADKERLREVTADVEKRIKKEPIYTAYTKMDMGMALPMCYLCSSAPFNNMTSVVNEEVLMGIGSGATMKHFNERTTQCPNCPMPHSFTWEIKEGPYHGERGVGLPGGFQMALGNPVGISYLPAIFKALNLSNDYGIDGFEVGLTIAAAIEWFEKGIITKADTDGLELKWGDHSAIIELVHRIVRRQGFGAVLADGAVPAAKKIGKGAEECISSCKGHVSGWLDWRVLKGGYLNEITSPSACEMMDGWPGTEECIGAQGWATPEYKDRIRKRYGSLEPLEQLSYNKAKSVVYNQDYTMMQNQMGICQIVSEVMFGGMLLQDCIDLFQAVTGLDVTKEDLVSSAVRVRDIERSFLVRQGYSRKDDWIDGRLLKDPVPDGTYKGEKMDPAKINEMLDEYYQLRGWDIKTGVPTRKKLVEDGLEDIAEDLEKEGFL